VTGLSEDSKVAVVNRLDPDGHIRDLIDVALQRYHQRRSVDDGAPHPMNERPNDGSPDQRP
jgi:hypothetical protein